MMFLKIPTASVADFGFSRFADHILDHSPVYSTRSLLRLGIKARDAIATAVDGIAEMDDDVGKLFQEGSEQAPVPRLALKPANGGEAIPIPASAFDLFYEAIEAMSPARPETEAKAPAEQSPKPERQKTRRAG